MKLYSLEKIMFNISLLYQIPEAEIKGESRKGLIPQARHLFCYVAAKENEYTHEEVGKFIDRDHSTVTNSCKVVRTELSIYSDIYIKLYEVKKMLESDNFDMIIIQDVNLLQLTKNYMDSFINRKP